MKSGSGGEGEADGAVVLLMPGDAEPLFGLLAHRLVDPVELEEPAKVGADLGLDVSVPPIGGEFVGSIFRRFLGPVCGDVEGAFEADDEFAVTGAVGKAAGLGIAEQLDTEFGAGSFESIDIADMGLDGGEVGHGGIGF
jgi:hypothetical protein